MARVLSHMSEVCTEREMIQKSIESQVHVEATVDESRNRGFADLAALPSNLGAIEAGMRFAESITPFVSIVGASGWGKTHLLNAVSQYMKLQGTPINSPMSATIYATFPDRTEETHSLLLDDVQDAWTNQRTKQTLRRLLERRVRAGRPTIVMFSDTVSGQEVSRYLPSARDWGHQSILPPTKQERDHVVRQIADSERVRLSRPIINLVSRHLYGNGRSIQGALHNLKLVRSDWSRRGDVCEACGILMPYIHGEDGWDPRDVVLDAVKDTYARGEGNGVPLENLVACLLISNMGLSEYDVATFLGVSPTRAYAMSNSVKLQLTDPCLSECVQICLDAVVRSLDGESC